MGCASDKASSTNQSSNLKSENDFKKDKSNTNNTNNQTKANSTAGLKIIIGPIIGSVTTNAARILVEFCYYTPGGDEFTGDNTEVISLTATLLSDNPSTKEQKSHTSTASVMRNVASVFKFSNLEPETKYKFSIDGNLKQIESSFKTFAEKLTEKNFKVAVCGCDDVIFNKNLGENSLYYNLAERAKNGDLNLTIHNGDQVYIDHKEKKDKKEGNPDHINIYEECHNLIKGKDKSEWEAYRCKILSKMKDLYRRTFSGKVAELMANCPNLMQYDDHEIHNNFGYNYIYSDENDTHCFITMCARRVYYEYQRQLREDVDYISFKNVTCDYHAHVINNIGFFFLDHRGARSWYKSEEIDYFGKAQVNYLKDCLESMFANCSIIVILSQDPLVLWNEELSKTQEKTAEMYIRLYKEAFERFMNIIADHKESKGKSQELIILGGDIHIGGFTEIYRNGKPICRQIISSGIGQNTKESLIKFYNNLMAQEDTNIGAGFSFKHHDWTFNRNYATLEMKLSNNEPIIESYLMISDVEIKPTKQKVILNTKFSL